MEQVIGTSVVILALLGFVAWLGGGRKWAFRILLSAVILAGVGVAGVLLYWYWTEKTAAHRTQKIHECAIAKVADPHCEAKKDSEGFLICPPYTLSDNPTPEQEQAAIAAADEECSGEIDLKQKSVHEQIAQYKREHGIKDSASAVDYDALAKQAGAIQSVLGPARCAAKVRKAYPHAYDDLDDATLTRKVLAKYPNYCDVASSPGVLPEIKGIR